jgi:hypothetical protein
MPKYDHNPSHWRERADQVRAEAARIADDERRRLMLRIADDYDALAEQAEEHLRAET